MAKRKGTLGDAVERMKALREADTPAETEPSEEATPEQLAKAKPTAPKRRRVTVYLETEAYAEARAAVLDLGGAGLEPASISALLSEALRRELDRLRNEHNRGDAWKPHHGKLPGGRPAKRL